MNILRAIATLVLVFLYATAPWHLIVEFGRNNATATVTIALATFCFTFIWGFRYWLEAGRMKISHFPQVAGREREVQSGWLTLGDISVFAALAIFSGFFMALRAIGTGNLNLSNSGGFAIVAGGVVFLILFYYYVVDHFDRRV